MLVVRLGILFLTLTAVNCGTIFDTFSETDVMAVKVRLEEDRAKVLLLENDLKVLMMKMARIERDEKNNLQENVQADQNGKRESESLGRKHSDPGSLYVRWGRKSCDGHKTQLVYEGFAAGSYFNHAGAAVNALCLPRHPIFNKTQPGVQSINGRGYVYGAEYEFRPNNSPGTPYSNLMNHEVPCAVCRAPRSTMLMVPGRNICYDGWTQEYRGYLISGHHGHNAATTYKCMDESPEFLNDNGNLKNNNGLLFYFVEGRCGSLPCPPYVEGNELTCAVCTR